MQEVSKDFLDGKTIYIREVKSYVEHMYEIYYQDKNTLLGSFPISLDSLIACGNINDLKKN